MDGAALIPVVDAILKAADEIDYGAEYVLGSGTGELAQDEVPRMSEGRWRLLRDQRNRAQWSPLHLLCVQGGISHGKLPILKALLQIGPDQENEQRTQLSARQRELIELTDRQNRNILHHLLDSVVPKQDAFEVIRFVLDNAPSIVLQLDDRGKQPIEYVLDRITENPGTRRRHYMMSFGYFEEGIGQNYRMLKLLVHHMAGMTDADGTSIDRSNVLHAACRIRDDDFSRVDKLIKYLVSSDASRLEAKTRLPGRGEKREVLLHYEPDARGNLPLHTFVGKSSYLLDSAPAEFEVVQCLANSSENELEPAAVSNDDGLLPLKIAMMSGRRMAIAALLMKPDVFSNAGVDASAASAPKSTNDQAVVPPVLHKEENGRHLTEPTGNKAGPEDIASPPQRHRDAFDANAQVHEEEHACEREPYLFKQVQIRFVRSEDCAKGSDVAIYDSR
ncbi:hypothetical protein THAOC_24539 [Thalassiosira oceanica]|uniref:Uncharacterized protein n=1 Tax=Thalassiosira oceanica TaxID=159749 RepID=K0RPN0_THAOC|nr:hypothetical protein THAOC_24539 [Thalassiosira oceanica]|eukprot:EJK55698.1 hypothetical protein THAOC_24539 [Thalassiosira oceanica]